MSVSSCSIAFGYAEFYLDYLSVPFNKGLMESSSAFLPDPSKFSSRNPRDCCLLALHGHPIYPPNERSIKDSVKDGASYSKTVKVRMKLFEDLVEKFNARQQQIEHLSGVAIKITIDDGPVLDSFPLEDYGGAAIVETAPQYEIDRKFSKLGQAARLNHFAQEYEFVEFKKLCEFLAHLDAEAQAMGYFSYDAICAPERYLKHLQRQLTSEEGMPSVLIELTKKQDILRQQTVFTIERFVACRRAGAGTVKTLDFFVDVTIEGVLISLSSGPFAGAGIVSSKYMSNRSDDFHRTWFA